MKRRAFIGMTATLALGAATVSAWIPKAAAAAMGPIDVGVGDETAALADHLLQAFPQRQSLQVIGNAYRRDQASGAPACKACMPDAFHDFLRHLDLSEDQLRSLTPAAMRTVVEEGNARDFSEGRIIGVEGWLLGETEARLCEVAALHRG